MSEILYPSCSELICELGASAIEDIRKVLRNIEDLTGWQVGAAYSRVEGEGGAFRIVDVESLDIHYRLDTDGSSSTFITNRSTPPGYRYSRLLLADSKVDVEWSDAPHYVCPFAEVSIYLGFSSDSSLELVAGDYDIDVFPFYAALRKNLGMRIHAYDGGSDYPFTHWCEQNLNETHEPCGEADCYCKRPLKRPTVKHRKVRRRNVRLSVIER